MSRPARIAVVGMGRSGTTVVMELLQASGAFLDEVNWAFEHDEARAVNDAYLAERFGARPGLPYGRLPDDEIEVPDSTWRERARSFVEAMDERSGGRPWAFKDPRTTVLHDLWLEHFDVVLGVFRRPDSVVESYMAQGWIKGLRPRRTALRYWERFNRSLLTILDAAGDRRTYLLETASDLVAQLDAVNAELGFRLDDGARDAFDASRQAPPASKGVGRAEPLYRELVRRRTVAP